MAKAVTANIAATATDRRALPLVLFTEFSLIFIPPLPDTGTQNRHSHTKKIFHHLR
jgi:hypothetical protein